MGKRTTGKVEEKERAPGKKAKREGERDTEKKKEQRD
jgi:hypothetical protein